MRQKKPVSSGQAHGLTSCVTRYAKMLLHATMNMNTSTNRINSVKQNSIPQELKALPQWVCWIPGKPRPDGKIPKIPTNPHTGKAAKVNDSTTWGTFDQAYQYFLTHENIQGVGFVFTDGYVGIDLDHCFLANGKVTPLAEKILNMVQTYT